MQFNFRKLKAEEIEIRVGQKSKSKPFQSLLLYKNARVDMALLDETFGAENWQRDHKELKGVIYCGVSVRDAQGDWVTKWDAGTESNTEAQKGEASDSFKRACVNWGIGRELYTAPQIWVDVNVNVYDLYVSRIAYNENGEIIDLAISGRNGIVWEMNKKTAPAAPVTSKGGAIYPAKEETPEDDDFTALLADIESVESAADLVALMKSDRVQKSPYKEALLRSGHNLAKKKGWE